MKKIFMSLMAFAAMAMTLTSCNKEEAATAGDFDAAVENSMIKTHMGSNGNMFWDNNDKVIIMDGSNNIARYNATTSDGASIHLTFERNIRGTFDLNNGTLTAFYPVSIVYNYANNYVLLPKKQTTATGAPRELPMYAKGTIDEFTWRNLCGMVELRLTGDVALDSIAITTDKFINGNFTVNISNLTTPLTYSYLGYSALAHGTKTNTLVFDNPFQTTSTAQNVYIYLPAGTYQSVDIAFYSNGTKCVKRYRNPITINRTEWLPSNISLNSADFVTFEKGAIDGQYNIGTTAAPQYVIFSQGNLEYVARNFQYWQFADNQWGFRTRYQCREYNSSFDRDLFAWGANGYYVAGHFTSGYGNNITVWANTTVKDYNYYTGTTLAGTNEWGNNKIANGGNQLNSGWRTLTAEEMQNILDNHEKAIVTLGFVGKTGLLLFPANYAGASYTDGDVITKQQYTALQNEGCVFFPVENYRMATGALANRIPATGTTSYYWLNTADETTAAALVVTANDYSIVPNANKKIGAFVRLVKDVQ